jgi:hypothetical protein
LVLPDLIQFSRRPDGDPCTVGDHKNVISMEDKMETIIELLIGWLPVLPQKRDPKTAAAIGFLFGGIGLAIYFRSVVDAIIPIVVSFVCVMVIPDIAGLDWLAGATIASAYGRQRVQDSNARLLAPQTA